MKLQWYPGHMTKAKRQMQEDLKLIDVIIELVDARIPYSSKNPDIDGLAAGKSRVLLINKTDLADPALTKEWVKYYTDKGFFVLELNSKTGTGIKSVNEVIAKACAEKIEKNRKKGIINRPMRAMIVGIPNVGKSTFINSFCKKAVAKTGNKPGVTKGKQWIRLNKDVDLLDTPGILWPKFEDETVGTNIAFIGSVSDEIVSISDLAYELIVKIRALGNDAIYEKYGVEKKEDAWESLRDIAIKRGCLAKGGEPDIDKASAFIVDDFRNGRIGRITLERP